MTRKVCLCALLLLAVVSTAPVFADAMHAYVWRAANGAVDLGVPSGYTSSVARGISDSGTIVGYAYRDDGGTCAFSWTDSTGIVGLDLLPGGQRSAAYGVNNLGQIVGHSTNVVGESRAVLWDTDGTIIDLGTLLPDNAGNSVAFAINDSGLVVGTADVPRDYETIGSEAFSWTSTTGMVDLGRAAAGDVISGARSVNNAGVIAGRSAPNADWSYAYLITPQGWVEVGDGIALGLNNSGVVVGNNGFGHGFVWDSLNGATALLPLPGFVSCQATAINAGGQIVGNSVDSDGHANATIWQPDGTIMDLGAYASGSYRSAAYAINGFGDVAGTIAVPDVPGAINLSFGLGLVALCRRNGQRRANKA